MPDPFSAPATARMGKSAAKLDKRTMGRVLRRVCGYLLRYPALCALALFLMVTSNVLALAGPKLSGLALDAIGMGSTSVDIGGVWYYAGLMIAFYVLSAALSYAVAALMVHISQKIVYTMRKQVFEHLTELPVGYFDAHATGDIISRVSYDIDTIHTSLSSDLLQVCASTVTVVGALVMMLTIKPILVLVFALTVPASVLFSRYKSKKIRPLFRRRSAELGALNGYAEEMLSGQKTIRAYHREAVIDGRFDKHNEDAVTAYYDADYQGSLIGPTVNFINNFSLALITTLGGIFYMLTLTVGAALSPVFVISVGDISAFAQYARKFAGPINEFANILSDLQSACSAAERVFRLLDEAPEPADAPDAIEATDVRGEVSIAGVSFGYDPERVVLHDFHLQAKPGQLVAIVGPTGAGKTTIINLLMRFYDIQSGSISLDGTDIRELSRHSLRAAYTMVLQDTWLFYGTIYENLTYGREDATEEEVLAAAKAAKLDAFVSGLPGGYQTVLTDDGVNLSKGQKQLITIARAMLPRSPMLILDEATSNVDSRTEIQIQQAMMSLMAGRTCFVIAHRLSTIRNADTILVVDGGNVVEQGTHEELLARKGFYYRLFRSQFET